MPIIDLDTLYDSRRKILTLPALCEERERLRATGVTVAAAGGCFDLLHIGHIRTLQAARRLGDRLVVMINSDASVRELKGPHRPIITEDARAEMLSALACVDYVVIFEGPSPDYLLEQVQPDVFCKGADYAPPHGKPLPEGEIRAVNSYGGRIAYLPLIPNNSTTAIIERIYEQVVTR